MPDADSQEHPQPPEPPQEPQEAFPSDAPERTTRRVAAKPFGQDAAHALMVKEEAIRTLSRQECFNRGYLTVKDLDDEELRYGRCRDENGLIPGKNGKRTQLIPENQYDSMIAEHELRFKQKLRQRLDNMLDIMVNIAEDDTVEPRDRFEAAKYIFERTAGKTPDKVELNVKVAPWETMLTQVTGIGAISRAEHRRLQQDASQTGAGAGIIDVEVVDENDLQPEELQASSEPPAEQDMVPVRPLRPGEQQDLQPQRADNPHEPPEDLGQKPFEHAPVNVDTPDPYEQYGSRRTEKRTYAEQARDAQSLAERRKEAKARINDAKKQRKIARATGADAIEDDITGATLTPDGKLTFE